MTIDAIIQRLQIIEIDMRAVTEEIDSLPAIVDICQMRAHGDLKDLIEELQEAENEPRTADTMSGPNDPENR